MAGRAHSRERLALIIACGLLIAPSLADAQTITNDQTVIVDDDISAGLQQPAPSSGELRIINENAGDIRVVGDLSAGVRVDEAGSSEDGAIFVENHGIITTGSGATGTSHQHGIVIGGNPATGDAGTGVAADVSVVNTGLIETHQVASRGIYILRPEGPDPFTPGPPGTVFVDTSTGTIRTLSSDIGGNTTDGIYIRGGNADVTVWAGNIEVRGNGVGVHALADGAVDISTAAGTTIQTFLNVAHGLETLAGASTHVEVAGVIVTQGAGASGVRASATSFFGPSDATSTVLVQESGRIHVSGAASVAIQSASSGAGEVAVLGQVEARGQNGIGVDIGSALSTYAVRIGEGGSVSGGWGQTSTAINVAGAGGEVVNEGSLTAQSDRLVTNVPPPDWGAGAEFGSVLFSNAGAMTGYFTLGSAGSNEFSNDGLFVVRDFSDTDGDSTRDTRSVAIVDLGGDDSIVRNGALGTIRMGAADAANYNSDGYYQPTTGMDGRVLDPSFYNFARNGLAQAQFVNTERFENAGEIDLRGPAIGNTLVITSGSDAGIVGTGTYVANGGVLRLNTVLNSGMNDAGIGSQSDMLIADRVELGSAATEIAVTRSGSGAVTGGNGIQLVEVRDNAHSAADTFVLQGDYVVSGRQQLVIGAYAYQLYQGGVGSDAQDGNWYLRSEGGGPQPVLQPGAPLYETMPRIALGMLEMPTLQQRVGNRSWHNGVSAGGRVGDGPAADATGFWARADGGFGSVTPTYSTSGAAFDQRQWRSTAGLDFPVYSGANGFLVAGLNVHHGMIHADVTSPWGSGRNRTSGYGFDATATWYGTSGFYADAQARLGWLETDLFSHSAGRTLVSGADSVGDALSLELGQRVAIGHGLMLIPQAQLTSARVRSDAFVDPFDTEVRLGTAHSLRVRAGLALHHEQAWTDAAGASQRAAIYGIANVHHEFQEGTKVRVADISLRNEAAQTWMEVALGGSYNLRDDTLSFYGEVQAATAVSGTDDMYRVGGKLGLRLRW